MLRNYLFLFVWLVGVSASAQVYKDATRPVEERVDDLLSRMTLEEKIAQLRHVHAGSILNADNTVDEQKLEKLLGSTGRGAVEGLPLSGKELARYARTVQTYCVEKTRLGIPIFVVAESLHGAAQDGATIFPQAVALGCTFNPPLAYQMTRAISTELHAMNVNQVLSPVLDVVRDLRWGRTEESFGEDPFLNTLMGLEEINGYLDGGISPMLKHLGPHGVSTSGLNLASTEVTERDLREIYLKPYELAVKRTGINAVMTTYNSTNRIPNTASTWLLTDVLRKEWGFKGYTYSDWGAISMLHSFHKVAPTLQDAAKMALTAGTDLEASSNTYTHLASMVEKGELDVKYIDRACARILYAKFKAGLFEHPYGTPPEEYDERVHTEEHVALSRRISEESVVLVKNENDLLPLDLSKLKSIAVIGPNADQVQFGDYTWSRSNQDGVTPLAGIRRYVGDRVAVRYAQGCDLVSDDTSGFAEAVEAARQSDVVLLCVGSASASLARDYRNATCGEGYDLTDLNLTGVQGELVKQLYGTGKPVVLVVVTGRPFSIAWEKEHIPAILFQWYGGEREGEVIADVLFGKVNPSGRLCYSIPQSVGHLPVHYNRLPSDNGFYRSPGSLNKPGRDYVFSAPEPLWPFGFGLSYADFAYENFKVDKESYQYSDTIRVTAALRNLSDREGKSVMQVYVKDVYSSVVMPVKQLKGIAKVSVPAQSTVKAHVAIPVSELGLYNAEMKYVVEPGEFQIMVGTSSADILFTQSIHVGQPIMTGETSLTENQTTKKAQASGKPMVVKGTIRDVQATLLAGVCVKVKGSKSETVSDAQGQYTLRCRSTDTLVFSKEGYGEQTVDVDGQEQLNMTME